MTESSVKIWGMIRNKIKSLTQHFAEGGEGGRSVPGLAPEMNFHFYETFQ